MTPRSIAGRWALGAWLGLAGASVVGAPAEVAPAVPVAAPDSAGVDVELAAVDAIFVARPVGSRVSFGTIWLEPPPDFSPDDALLSAASSVVRLPATHGHWRAELDVPRSWAMYADLAGDPLPLPPPFVEADGSARARAWTIEMPVPTGPDIFDPAVWCRARMLVLVGFDATGRPERAYVTNAEERVGTFSWERRQRRLRMVDADANGRWGTPGDLWAVEPVASALSAEAFVARDRPSEGFWLRPVGRTGRRAQLVRQPHDDWRDDEYHVPPRSAEPDLAAVPPVMSVAAAAPGCGVKAEPWVATLLCAVEATVAGSEGGSGSVRE